MFCKFAICFLNSLKGIILRGEGSGVCWIVFFCFFVCCAEVSHLSRWTPKYLVIFWIGLGMLFSDNWGHYFMPRATFIWTDLFSLVFIFHFLVQFEIRFRWCCILFVAIFGSLFENSIAVSSPLKLYDLLLGNLMYKYYRG